MPEYDYVWSDCRLAVGAVGAAFHSSGPAKPRRKRKIDRLGGVGFVNRNPVVPLAAEPPKRRRK